MLADATEINRLHQQTQATLTQEIHENYHLYKNKMQALQQKADVYLGAKAKRVMKVYEKL